MSSDVRGVGDLFKQRRKEMNLSLKEVENATSIRMGYLKAIEEGEMNKLISPVYALGFVKQYAAFLGVDAEQLIKDHPDIFSSSASPEFSYGIGTLEVRGNPGSGIKWLPNALWFGVFALILVASWFLARYLELI